MHINKPFPPEWAGRKSISAAEYKAWLAGQLKAKEKSLPKLRTNRRQDFATHQNGVLTIVIHELPPSQNAWKQWHYIALNNETQRWNDLIILLARNATQKQFTNPVVKFRFFFPDNRPRDRKNYESWKPLLDGLTRAGVIADDNYREIREEPADIEVDRGNPRTEILVWKDE